MNTHQMPALLRFACDSIPDCSGQVVQCIGDFVILEGMAADSGNWFAKGPSGPRKFSTRQEAVDYIEYAQDAYPRVNTSEIGGRSIEPRVAQLRQKADWAEKDGNSAEARKLREQANKLEQGQDEPIAADPEEVKKAWRSASAAAQKSNAASKSKEYKQDYGGASEDEAKDCDATDASYVEKVMGFDPKDLLHQIEGSYRNMDVPTIRDKRKQVIAIMDNAANPPAIRDAAKGLLQRMNRVE